MASFLDRAQLARHEGFRDRVKIAMLVTAVNVAAEDDSAMDPRTSQLRSALATNVVNDPEGYATRFAWACVTNPTVADAGLSAPDGDLEFVVASVFNALAGV